MATTVKIGEGGTIALPEELRRQFGLQDGSLVVVDVSGGEIRLRTLEQVEQPAWSPEETAYYMLMSSRSREEWDAKQSSVLAMGVDPAKGDGVDPNYRELLPTLEQYEAQQERRRASRLEELHRP